MNGLMDCVFPYLIQFLKEYTGKVDLLYTERKERQSAAVDEESAKKQQVHSLPLQPHATWNCLQGV